MNDILNYCELNLDVYDLQRVPDEVIKSIITDYSKDVAMFAIFFRNSQQLNPNNTPKDFDYFVNFVNDIARVSGFDYSEDELKVYRMYAVPLGYKNMSNKEMQQKLISNYEEVDSLKVDGVGPLYAQECVRYKLLQIYADEFVKYYDKMKDLLTKLKASKSKYRELEDNIYRLLSEEGQ